MAETTKKLSAFEPETELGALDGSERIYATRGTAGGYSLISRILAYVQGALSPAAIGAAPAVHGHASAEIAGLGTAAAADVAAFATAAQGALADTALQPGDVPPTVSADAGNSITAGADGGAFLDASGLGGGGGAVAIEDESVAVVAAASTLDFIGGGVTVTDQGLGKVAITIPGTGGAGVTNLVELDDVATISVSPADVGRVLGLVGVAPRQFGLMQPTITPLSGGIEVETRDLAAAPASEVVFTGLEPFDQVWFVLDALTSGTGGVVEVRLSADGGVTFLQGAADYQRTFLHGTARDSDPFGALFFAGGGNVVNSLGPMNGVGSISGHNLAAAPTFGSAFSGNTGGSAVVESGHTAAAGAHNAILFKHSGLANWTGGKIHLYKVRATAQPFPVVLDAPGQPAGAGTIARTVAAYGLRIRGGASGDFAVLTPPAGVETVSIRDDGVEIGTLSVAATGVVTVDLPSEAIIARGSLITLDVAGARSFAGLTGALRAEQAA